MHISNSTSVLHVVIDFYVEFNALCLANIKEFVGVSDAFLEKMKKWITTNQVEGTKITHKDSYSLNLSTLGDLNVSPFFHGLVANFEFPIAQLRVINLKKTLLVDSDCSWFAKMPELINLNVSGKCIQMCF